MQDDTTMARVKRARRAHVSATRAVSVAGIDRSEPPGRCCVTGITVSPSKELEWSRIHAHHWTLHGTLYDRL